MKIMPVLSFVCLVWKSYLRCLLGFVGFNPRTGQAYQWNSQKHLC